MIARFERRWAVRPLELVAPSDSASLMYALRRPVRAGVLVIGLFFGGIGWWAASAPLAGAAIAPGVVSPDGSRRVVQHLEGGIIREILVSDGTRVRTGAR
jgi:HlyD family secretion protein